nr:BTB/POZ domain-containing protein KCTD19-like [Lytechinus pictus]
MDPDYFVGLNVGGKIYQTSRSTLSKYPDSFLARLLYSPMQSATDDHGNYRIDQDGEVFRHVLNFLRHGQLMLPDDFKDFDLLKCQADFFGLESLKSSINIEISDGLLYFDEYGGETNSFVGLNVGGKIYQTSRTNLSKNPESFLARLLDIPMPSAADDHGNYRIDQDGEVFRHVLNFLRYGKLTLPDDFKEFDLLKLQADSFGLESLKSSIVRPVPIVATVGLRFDDGKVFHTTRETLMKVNNSFFTKMLNGEITVARDFEGNYVMDRDGRQFQHILNYLREGNFDQNPVTPSEPLYNDAKYFGLEHLATRVVAKEGV